MHKEVCNATQAVDVQFKMHKWMLSLTANQLKFVLLSVQIQVAHIATRVSAVQQGQPTQEVHVKAILTHITHNIVRPWILSLDSRNLINAADTQVLWNNLCSPWAMSLARQPAHTAAACCIKWHHQAYLFHQTQCPGQRSCS